VDDYATVEVVQTEAEAELLCGLLRSAGILCMHRLTNRGAGAFEGLPVGGPHEVVVHPGDLQWARDVLAAQRSDV
jgi:hypothetical protein